MPEVSLIIPARNAATTVEATVRAAHEFLSLEAPGSFEIVLVPNPRPGDASDGTEANGRALIPRFPELRVIPHLCPPNTPGKGAAVRTGFLASRGALILFTDADLPYDLEFFSRALKLLRQGQVHLVTGNRRLLDSVFDIPVALLPLAYGRHRLGLAFNRVTRLLMPTIRTTDTQAGLKAFSRRLAEASFPRQACPGFFFDLELLLTAKGHGLAAEELPVSLLLNSEKSTVRLLRELLLSAVWLTRIALRNARGAYSCSGPEASR